MTRPGSPQVTQRTVVSRHPSLQGIVVVLKKSSLTMAQVSEGTFSDLLTEINAVDYYELLGCDETSSKEQINVEFKKKALEYHPDKNRDKHDTNHIFQRLKKARDVLCDNERRKTYDAWRLSGLQCYVPYEKWIHCNMRASLHWAPKASKKHMLTEKEKCSPYHKHGNSSESNEKDVIVFAKCKPYTSTGWGSKKSLIRKFKMYEI